MGAGSVVVHDVAPPHHGPGRPGPLTRRCGRMGTVLPRLEIVRRLRPVDLVAPGSVQVDTDRRAGSCRCRRSRRTSPRRPRRSRRAELALHLGRAPARGVARGRLGVAPSPTATGRGSCGAAGSTGPRRRPARPDPDRHPRDGLDARGGAAGSPGPATTCATGTAPSTRDEAALAGCGSSSPTAAAPPAASASSGCATSGSSPRGTARPVRDGGRVAHRDVGRSGLLRHRPHQRVALRPRRARRSTHRSRPVLPPARRAGRLRRPRHPPRPRRRRVAGGDQHVGRLRDADDARRTAYAVRGCGSPSPSPAPTCCAARTSSTPASCRCPTDGLARSATGTRTSCAPASEWLVGFVSARRFFDFHPALAGGPSLDELRLRGAATDRRATEGTTLLEVGGRWRCWPATAATRRRGRRRGSRSSTWR